MPLLLTGKDVEAVLTMEKVIDAVEEAFRQYNAGTVEMPVRLGINIAKNEGLMLYMPAYIGGEMDALGMKVVSVYPYNPSRHNLPTVMATIFLNDAETSQLMAIMDGTFITAMRTGAVSGVATRYLAREDSRTVGVYGAGVQGRTQLMAVCAVRDIERALVYDISPEARERFCQEMAAKLGIEVTPAAQPREAAEGIDVIVTATTSRTPVFEDEWLAEGSHINGVGSHTAELREVGGETVKRAKVVVDARDAALSEAGDLIIPINRGLITADHIYADLGEIVAGKPARTDPEEITFFKSVGLAIQDVSTASMVYKLAREKGVGQEVAL